MSHQIKFEQLLDLAFGEPEQGVLNIRFLHAFLQALLSQVKLGSVRVELKGDQFTCFDELVDCMNEKPYFHVTEYEAQKNEHSGKYDKKKQIKATPNHVDKLVMIRDTKEKCSVSKVEKLKSPLMVDERMNIIVSHGSSKSSKPKSSCSRPKEEDQPVVDSTELEHRILRLEQVLLDLSTELRQCQERTTRPTTGESSGKQSIQSTSTTSEQCPPTTQTSCATEQKLGQTPNIFMDDIDMGAVFQCLAGMNRELEELKHDNCKTQKILNGLCENSKVMAMTEEEADLKICEIQTILDDHLKRIEKLFVEICTCKKAVEENTNRIDIAFEEQETLFRVKADKDVVEALLNEKADRSEVEKKLDRDVFEKERCELHERIAHTNKQLKLLSNELNTEVDKLTQCLLTKLDRETFKTFAVCVDNRIKAITHETKRWINVKKKEVCPFTRTPFEQNLCCGVCNNPVVMRGQECIVPKMSPMLNMAWNQNTQASKCCRTGGPHTVTTPNARVCRTSKFMPQSEAQSYASATDCRSGQIELDFDGNCFKDLCGLKEKVDGSNNGAELYCGLSKTSMKE